MKALDMLRLEPSHAYVIDAARAQLDHARAVAKKSPSPRDLHRLHFSFWTMLELTMMVALPTAALVWFKPLLMQFWFDTIVWWSAQLQFPATLKIVNGIGSVQWDTVYASSLVPTAVNGAVTASLVIAAYTGTFWMTDRQTPLKYLVRLLCLVQASALLFFMFLPSLFSYTLAGHVTAMLEAGYYLMLAVPLLLALGWGVLQVPTYQKLMYPGFIVVYFALMVPHKALLHALILQHFSVLFMPFLYLCFGTVFDLMVFVALYSWLASMAPAHALDQGITP